MPVQMLKALLQHEKKKKNHLVTIIPSESLEFFHSLSLYKTQIFSDSI